MLPFLGEGRRRVELLSSRELTHPEEISLLESFEQVWTEYVANDLRRNLIRSVCLVPKPLAGQFVKHQLQIPVASLTMRYLDGEANESLQGESLV